MPQTEKMAPTSVSTGSAAESRLLDGSSFQGLSAERPRAIYRAGAAMSHELTGLVTALLFHVGYIQRNSDRFADAERSGEFAQAGGRGRIPCRRADLSLTHRMDDFFEAPIAKEAAAALANGVPAWWSGINDHDGNSRHEADHVGRGAEPRRHKTAHSARAGGAATGERGLFQQGRSQADEHQLPDLRMPPGGGHAEARSEEYCGTCPPGPHGHHRVRAVARANWHVRRGSKTCSTGQFPPIGPNTAGEVSRRDVSAHGRSLSERHGDDRSRRQDRDGQCRGRAAVRLCARRAHRTIVDMLVPERFASNTCSSPTFPVQGSTAPGCRPRSGRRRKERLRISGRSRSQSDSGRRPTAGPGRDRRYQPAQAILCA